MASTWNGTGVTLVRGERFYAHANRATLNWRKHLGQFCLYAIENVIIIYFCSSFYNRYLKNTNPNKEEEMKTALNRELEKLNLKLEESGKKYLDGDHLTQPDLRLLPRLHHVIVAGKIFKVSLGYFARGHGLWCPCSWPWWSFKSRPWATSEIYYLHGGASKCCDFDTRRD